MSSRAARRVWFLAVGLGLTALLPEQSASACLPPDAGHPMGWLSLESVDEPLRGVPREGVLVVLGQHELTGGLSSADSVEVRGPDGNVVPGSLWTNLEFQGPVQALVWRSFEPLAPETTYRAKVSAMATFGAPIERAFEFVTTKDPWPALSPLEVARHSLGETRETSATWCCPEPRPNECSRWCWDSAYNYFPTLRLNWAAHSGLGRYGWVGLQAQPFVRNVSADDQAGAVVFTGAAPEYCAVFTVRSLVDGTSVESEPYCVSHDELVPIDRIKPPKPDPSQCESLADAGPDGDPSDAGDVDSTQEPGSVSNASGCGCRAVRAEGSGFIWAGVVALGAIVICRRRSPRPSRSA